MEVRKLTYDEAKDLYDKLTAAGYPTQIFYSTERWKVSVEGLITNGQQNDIFR